MSFMQGDDLSAIVCDIGSGSTKIGMAGRDVPSMWAPTVALASAGSGVALPSSGSSGSSDKRRYGKDGRYSFGLSNAGPSSSDATVKRPLVEGLVEDWDAVEAIFHYAVSERLPIAAAAAGEGTLHSHPVLMSEHMNSSKTDREKWCQILFEKHGCPGAFMSRGGVLALYANARTTGLVVDMGAGGTQITPVQDGYALMMGARCHPLGGQALDELLLAAVQQATGVAFPDHLERAAAAASRHASSASSSSSSAAFPFPGPSTQSSSGGTVLTLAQWRLLEAARDMKESVCSVAEVGGVFQMAGAPSSSSSSAAAPAASPAGSPAAAHAGMMSALPYELPDGTVVNIAAERQSVPELMFSREHFSAAGAPHLAPLLAPSAQFPGLHELIVASAVACNPEVRRELVGNLVLTGASSALSGVADRLGREFGALAPVGTKPRWALASPDERKLGVWLGGSILASLDTCADLWFTREEYNEHGAKLIHRKCP